VKTIETFTTDWGTYPIKDMLDAMRASGDRLINAAADMVELILPDHKAMHARREKHDAAIEELERLAAALEEYEDGE
jgi:hypothetical protein